MANSIKIDLELEGKDALTTIKKLERALGDLTNEGVKDVKKLDGAFQSFAGNLGAIAATRAFDFIKDSILGSVEAFAAFERGLTGVAKTTNFTDAEVTQFSKNIEKLTKEIPATTDELLGIAEAAGQLGVSGLANVTKFTETIAKLGRVSNLEGDFAATTLTRILNITGESIGEIDTLADVIVDLGNNFAASEAEIAAVANEVARATQNYGVASSEAAALSAALRSLGVRAEEAGGVINRSFQAIDAAIRDGGKPLEQLVKLTGIARDEIKDAFGKNAIGVFQKFSEGLGRVGEQGGSIVNTLAELGLKGVRVTSVLPALANNSELFATALERANKQVREGGAVNAEFAQTLEDTDTKIKLFSNSVDELQRTLFSKVAPAFNNTTDVFTAFVNKLSALAKGDEIGAAEANIKGLEATIKDVSDTTKFINRFLPEFAANINSSFAEDRVRRLKEEIAATKDEVSDLNAGVSAEQGLGGYAKKIEEAEEKLKNLQAAAKNYIRIGREVFPKSPEAIKKQNDAIAQQAALVEELKNKAAELRRVRGAQAAFEAQEGQKKLEAIKEQNEAEIIAEQEKITFLDELRRTRAEAAATRKEEEKLAKELENEQDFQTLSTALGREEAARELFRIKNITDEKKRLDAIRKLRETAQKKEEARQKQAQKNEEQLDLATQKAKVNILSATANLASVIGKQGSKEVFLIQKAAALAQAIVATNTATAQALAVPPSPNIPLAKLAATAGGINIAAISAAAIKGFQSGGIAPEPVSGVVQSPSQTGDQTLIGVNGGEVIFNKRQQQNLFDFVNRGAGGGGGTNITINNPVLLDEGSVDQLIDQINDRVEFANRELKSTEVVDAA